MHVRAIAAGVSLLLSMVGCGRDPLPDGLIQVWHDPAPGYSDRFFEVREDSIIFGTGAARVPSRHTIEDVQSQRVGDGTEVTIEYRTDDGEVVPVNLVFTPGRPPRLRIGARNDEWTPEGHSDPPRTSISW